MFSETCLKYKPYQSLLQPPPILAPKPKTFQSNLWLRKSSIIRTNFIHKNQDSQRPHRRHSLHLLSDTGPACQPLAPPTIRGQHRNQPDKASCLHRSVSIPRDSALLSLSSGSTWSSSPPTDQRVGEQSLLHQDFYHPDTLSGRIGLCA
jgi:hypothetical protein